MLTPPLHGPVRVNLGPFAGEYSVHTVVYCRLAGAITDVDDAPSLVCQQYPCTDVLPVRRPREERGPIRVEGHGVGSAFGAHFGVEIVTVPAIGGERSPGVRVVAHEVDAHLGEQVGPVPRARHRIDQSTLGVARHEVHHFGGGMVQQYVLTTFGRLGERARLSSTVRSRLNSPRQCCRSGRRSRRSAGPSRIVDGHSGSPWPEPFRLLGRRLTFTEYRRVRSPTPLAALAGVR